MYERKKKEYQQQSFVIKFKTSFECVINCGRTNQIIFIFCQKQLKLMENMEKN